MTPITRINFDDSTVSPGYFMLCTPDQQVNYSYFDNACNEIKSLCLQHIVSENDKEHFIHGLDAYCLHRKNIYVGAIKFSCMFRVRSISYAKQFISATQHQMIYQLRSVNVDILTDRDIDVSNQIIPVVETFYCYHLTISPANNRTVHIHISNSTINNVYIYLDNSKISAHITNNAFTGAGIKISSTSTDLYQPVIIENSIFKGLYSKPILEVLNTTNVYLHSCVFNNSKLGGLPVLDDNECSRMLCFNSKIELVDIFFREVSFFPFAAFENCTLAIYRLTMSGNSLLSQSLEKNSLL